MNQSVSIISLIAHASIVVQLVMLILVVASIVSWVIIFQKGALLRQAQKDFMEFEERFWSGVDLNQLYRECQQSATPTSVEVVFMAGLKEFGRLRQQHTTDPDTLLEGVQRAMRVAITRENDVAENNLPLLATVGSTSPYVGLFGTVWGIMHSFQGLATVKQATIATVAPGISEALVATAMGLLAAIPAVVFYNRFVVSADKHTTSLQTFGEEFSALLHRQTLKAQQQGREQSAEKTSS